MPIYEETYRTWQGRLVARPRTWWIIARTGSRLLWKRTMMLLVLLAAVPFAIRAGQIYAATRLGDYPQLADFVQELQIDAEFFAEFLRGQTFFLILILILAGAGLVANDRKFRALSIYFSKPVSFWDYVLGKFMILGFYGGLVTLLPGLFLLILRVLLSPDTAFLQEYYWVLFALIGQAGLTLLLLGGIVLAVSAAAARARTAGILFFALLTVADLFRQVLPGVAGLGLLSPAAILRQSNSLIFGLRLPFEFSAWIGLAVLFLMAGISLAVLWYRVRPVEVVR